MTGGPSRTAMRVALRRAVHQLVDVPLVLDDPIAVRIVGAERAEAIRETAAFFSWLGVTMYLSDDAFRRRFRTSLQRVAAAGWCSTTRCRAPRLAWSAG